MSFVRFGILCITVTCLTIRKHDETILRSSNNLNMSEYRATIQGNLKTHEQSKPESVIYLCKQCEYHQHDRTSWRLTNNINIKLLNVHLRSVNIRQQHTDFLRYTNNLNMKVLNIPVPNVNIKVSNKGWLTVADIKYSSWPKRSGNMKLYFCHLRLCTKF